MTDKWKIEEVSDIGFDGLTHSEVVVYVDELHAPEERALVSLNLKEAGEYINILEVAIRKFVEEFTDVPVAEWEGMRQLESGVGELGKVLIEEPFQQILEARIQGALNDDE